jgi:hypothetical protein
MATNIKVEGIDKLEAQLRDLLSAVEPRETDKITLKWARRLRDWVRPDVPVGATGNLKRAVKAFRARRRGKMVGAAVTWVDRRIAPHLHLVSFGTKAHTIKPKVRSIMRNSVSWFGRIVNHPGAEENAFFADTVSDAEKAIVSGMTTDVADAIARKLVYNVGKTR